MKYLSLLFFATMSHLAFAQDIASAKTPQSTTNASLNIPSGSGSSVADAALPTYGDSTSVVEWGKDMRETFVNSCVKSAKKNIKKSLAKTYCECMLEKIVVLYPNAIDVAKLTEEQATQMATDCIQ